MQLLYLANVRMLWEEAFKAMRAAARWNCLFGKRKRERSALDSILK